MSAGLIAVMVTFACVAIVALPMMVSYQDEQKNKDIRKRNAGRKVKLQETFSKLSAGTPFSVVVDGFGKCEAISAPHLGSEIMLENGINRKVYIWYLDWEYTVSKSSGVGVMPIHTSTFNTGGNGMSFSNGTAMGFTNGKTTQKAFIQMVFENDKLIAKEQQGLYE